MNSDIDHEIRDDGAILHTVEQTPSGRISGVVRVYCRVRIEGVDYWADRQVRVAFRKETEKTKED